MSAPEDLTKAQAELIDAKDHERRSLERRIERTKSKEALTSFASETLVRSTLVELDVATEVHLLSLKGVKLAEVAVSDAEEAVTNAAIFERHQAQYRHGIKPILDLAHEIDAHAQAIAKLQQTQYEIFVREVVQRNDRWVRTQPLGFQPAPMFHFESVADVVVRGQGGVWRIYHGELAEGELDRNRANAAAERTSGNNIPWADSLTDEHRDQLAFCLENRGASVAGDMKLDHGLAHIQLRDLAGVGAPVGPGEFGWVEITNEILGEIVRGLPRAMNIAEAQAARAGLTSFDQRPARNTTGWTRGKSAGKLS